MTQGQKDVIDCPHCGVTFNPMTDIQFHKPKCSRYRGDLDD